MALRMDLVEKFVSACGSLGAKRGERAVPSPSSVSKCTRQNWFKSRGYPVDNYPDPEGYISQEGGRLSEPLLQSILEEAGIVLSMKYDQSDEGRELMPEQLARVNMNGGQVDNVGVTPEGDEVLVEFKRKNVYSMKALWLSKDLSRCSEGQDDYTQLQSLLHALDLKKAIYVAAAWDRSALTQAIRPKVPMTYIDEVAYNPMVAKVATERAARQDSYIKNEDTAARVPRDHNPTGGPKADWQCRWCSWWNTCVDAGVERG